MPQMTKDQDIAKQENTFSRYKGQAGRLTGKMHLNIKISLPKLHLPMQSIGIFAKKTTLAPNPIFQNHELFKDN